MKVKDMIKDMITDPVTGTVSHNKVWGNIGMAAMTYVFIKIGLAGTMTDTIMFVYGAIVAGSATAAKFLSLKMGKKAEECESKTSDKLLDK